MSDEMKDELSEIIKLIHENEVSAWEDDLEDTRQVVVLEDFRKQIPGAKYNGWLERLKKLHTTL